MKQASSLLNQNGAISYRGYGTDEAGHLHLVIDIGGRTLVFPAELIGKGAFFDTINAAGAGLYHRASRDQELKQIGQLDRTKIRFEIANKIGWHDKSFVTGSKIIGKSDRELLPSLEHLRPDSIDKYRSAGTLNGWDRAVLPLCAGNSRLMLGVCWAFASVVAPFIPGAEKGGGFQLFGPKGKGKTSAAIAAGSVWGCSVNNPQLGFAESWNATVNDLESQMAAHRHVGLILDETGASTGDIANALFRLCGGVGKKRMGEPTLTFEGFIFSTSNPPIWDLIGGQSRDTIAAVASRMTDIPLPEKGHGIFEELHGRADGAELSNDLRVACLEHFGTAGRTFVKRVIAWIATKEGEAECRQYLDARRAAYLKAFRRRAKGMVYDERSTARFATIYAAGRLARHCKVISWNWRKIREAVLTCHLDAAALAQSTLGGVAGASHAPGDALSALQSYVKKHWDRFVDVSKSPLRLGTDKFGGAKGYLASFKEKRWVYLTVDQFKQIVGGYAAAHALVATLASKGLADARGGSITTQRPVYRGGKGNKNHARVVAIRLRAVKGRPA